MWKKIQYIAGEVTGYVAAGMILSYLWVHEKWQKLLNNEIYNEEGSRSTRST